MQLIGSYSGTACPAIEPSLRDEDKLGILSICLHAFKGKRYL